MVVADQLWLCLEIVDVENLIRKWWRLGSQYFLGRCFELNAGAPSVGSSGNLHMPSLGTRHPFMIATREVFILVFFMS